jgi:hypothetical protein
VESVATCWNGGKACSGLGRFFPDAQILRRFNSSRMD